MCQAIANEAKTNVQYDLREYWTMKQEEDLSPGLPLLEPRNKDQCSRCMQDDEAIEGTLTADMD